MVVKPFISVCVAIYNVDKYLDKCLSSLKEQKFQNVEFILIDDCSTDKSVNICEKFCKQDNRFKLIRHKKNLGSLKVRKTGIEESKGIYTTFIDGDDYYTSAESLIKIYDIINKYNTDIIRFECECVGEDLDSIKNVTQFVSIKNENSILDSFSALESIFEKCNNAWCLAFHVFKTRILKEVIDTIPDEYLIFAEDAFILFITIYSSKNYAIVHSGPLYSYRIGSGISTTSITPSRFREMAKEVRITKWIDDKLHKDHCDERYFCISKALRHRLLLDTAYRLQELPDAEQAHGLDLIVNEGYIPETITVMREAYRGFKKMRLLAKNLCNASSLRFSPKPIKTIGILYHRYFDGGVERVISLQIPIFLRLGYRIVLFTEEINEDIEYPLPQGVRRVLLPRDYDAQRANALAKSLKTEHIDVLLNHEASSEDVLWDILLTKLMHITVILTFHGPCWTAVLYNPCIGSFDFESARPFIYKIADYLIILSSSFKKFFDAYGCRTIFVPNPCTFNFQDTKVPLLDQRNGVLWLGRLDDSQKHWRDVLYIMEKLAKLVPGVQCYIGGSEYDVGSVDELKNFISQHSLGQSVHWIGRRTDVKELLQHCRVFLMTSSFEAFPMSLAEAKVCGAPVIIYNIPYLEMLQNPKGVLIVPQRDTKSMIEESIKLLQDDSYCEQLILDSRESAEDFYKMYDLVTIWKNIFCSLDKNLIPVHEDKGLQQCFDLLLNASKKNLPTPFYNDGWPKWKRTLFLIFFDRNLLKKKVKNKFYKYPLLLNIMKFFYNLIRNIYHFLRRQS